MQSADAEVLKIDGLEVGYGRTAILPPVHLTVRRGEMWAVLGHNGGGKTTLLRTLLGLLPRVGGGIVWASGRRHVGYVPQRSSVDADLPARTIDVVRKGLHQDWSFLNPLGWLGQGATVDRAMRDTRTPPLRSRQFGTLSEGEKQRVLMAQALVSDPPMLILDEPTSAMDLNAERATFELLEGLRRDRNLAVMLVSHHLAVVAEYASHVLLVDKDARFLLSGTVEEVAAHPAWQERFGRVFDAGLARRRAVVAGPVSTASVVQEVLLGQ